MLYRFIRYWLPPLLWMAFIFFLSSQKSVTITGTFTIDFFIFKGLHVIEYAFLYFLLFRAFYSVKNNHFTLKNRYAAALLLSILFSVTDEYHQTFVTSRQGTVRDILIDTAAIILLYIYIRVNLNAVKRFL